MKKTILLTSISFVLILFFGLGIFLDITEPPKKVDIIVCLGGNDKHRIPMAISLLKNGYSKDNKILYLGTKKGLLSRNKEIPNLDNFIFSGNVKNTKEEIDFIEGLLFRIHFKSIIFVTEPMNSRRIDFFIQNFNKYLKKDVQYTFVSTNINWWNKYLYFTNTKSLVYSFLELSKITYNYIKYTYLEDETLIKRFDKKASDIKRYISKNYKY